MHAHSEMIEHMISRVFKMQRELAVIRMFGRNKNPDAFLNWPWVREFTIYFRVDEVQTK